MRATNTDAMRCDMLNITVVVALETVFWGFVIYLVVFRHAVLTYKINGNSIIRWSCQLKTVTGSMPETLKLDAMEGLEWKKSP